MQKKNGKIAKCRMGLDNAKTVKRVKCRMVV